MKKLFFYIALCSLLAGSVVAQVIPRYEANEGDLDGRAYHYYVNGVILEQAGDYVGAAENYRRALKFQGNSYEIRYAFGSMLFKLQRFEESLAILGEIEPMDTEALKLIASSHRALGEEEAARDAYRQVVQLDSTDLTAYGYLANEYRKMRDVDSTLWSFENIVRVQPENFRIWQDLAKHQLELGNDDSARVLFENSIAHASRPENSLSYVGLGEILQAQGKADSASTVFLDGLSVDPDNILLNRLLTSHYISQDSLGEAVTYARRLAELSPYDRAAARRLGSIYFEIDSLDQSREIFESMADSGQRSWIDHYYLGRIAAINDELHRARDEFILVTELADTLPGGWLDLALVYQRLNQEEKEIETYRKGLNVVREEGDAVRLLFALGAALERADRVEESIETFEKIIERFPDNHQAMNYLGYTLADRDIRLEYARELIERALEHDPENAAYVDSYGWVLYRLGQYNEAVEQLETAAGLQADPVIYDHLGDALAKTGNEDEARQWWQKALELDPENDAILKKLNQ